MLTQIGIKKHDKPIEDFLEELNDNSENSQLNDNSVEFVKSQKAQIKELQEKIEQAKNQYKLDKAQVEDLRLSDPALYRKKSEVLFKVKEGLDRRIQQINSRVAKVKELEQ